MLKSKSRCLEFSYKSKIIFDESVRNLLKSKIFDILKKMVILLIFSKKKTENLMNIKRISFLNRVIKTISWNEGI